MTPNGEGAGEAFESSPEEAFAVLGNETRLQVLLALGEADGPLSFSELYEAVDYETTANFSYHLEKLEDYFVERSDDGYRLRQTGRRVVEAVLSGAVTQTPVLDRTPTDTTCFLCDSSMEVDYREERVGVYCPDCRGTRGASSDIVDRAYDPEIDLVGAVTIPPAGTQQRTPGEVLDAAEIWTVTEVHATARGVCPRCSASVERSVRVCDDHEVTDERCERCDQQFGVTLRTTCTNCIFDEECVFTRHLLANTDLMAFMIEHGIDPVAPDGFHISAVEETILSSDPFEARFAFSADGETLVLRVDEDLSIVDVARRRAVETE